jgi:S1-C subfamily serine protease
MSVLLFTLFAPAPFTQPVRVHLGVDFVPGGNELRIATVFTSSPAHKAGLWSDDVILEVDGTKVQRLGDLVALLRKKKAGAAMSVTIHRDNVIRKVHLTLAERRVVPYLGVSTNDLGDPFISVVAPGSPASEAGLRINDRISTIDGTRVRSTVEIAALLRKKKPGDVVAVALLRQGRNMQVRVKLGTRPGY